MSSTLNNSSTKAAQAFVEVDFDFIVIGKRIFLRNGATVCLLVESKSGGGAAGLPVAARWMCFSLKLEEYPEYPGEQIVRKSRCESWPH
jgi:hypothetical protein